MKRTCAGAVVLLVAMAAMPAMAEAKKSKPRPRIDGTGQVTVNQTATFYASGFPARTHLQVYVRFGGSEGISNGNSIDATFLTDSRGKATISFVFPDKHLYCVPNQGCFQVGWIDGNQADLLVSTGLRHKPGSAERRFVVNGPPATL